MTSRAQYLSDILAATGKLPNPGATYVTTPLFSVPQSAAVTGIYVYTGTQPGTWQLPDISLPPGLPESGVNLVGCRVAVHNGSQFSLQVATVWGQSIERGQGNYLATLTAGGFLDLEGHFDGTSYFWAPNAAQNTTLAANTLAPGNGVLTIVGQSAIRTP